MRSPGNSPGGGATLSAIVLLALVCPIARASVDEAKLPRGVKAVWDVRKAFRESTPTRERISINGLWRWRPAESDAEKVPANGWGFLKVPGCWPGITNWMQKDSQTVHVHPSWRDTRLRDLTAAWYQREISVPGTWSGRRITLVAETLNSFAVVFVDGRRVDEMRFPGGEVDLTSACRSGRRHVLSLLVTALPLKGVMLSYDDTAAARKVKGEVARRGLCGDVWLVGEPTGARLADVRVETSFRRGEITIDAGLEGLSAGRPYVLTARILDRNREVAKIGSKSFRDRDAEGGRLVFTGKWLPEKLWDLHTPGNVHRLELVLRSGGKVRDAALPVRFGFRELRVDGRDFRLNGSRLHLVAVPLDNAQIGASSATYEAARESLLRLKGIGVNLVFTHNYGCQPGSHLSFEEILRAADDVGMLVSLSQPHFGHYEWKAPDADATNGYAAHAASYVRVAGNHPSVVAYGMSHNATGYSEDMNPDLIDGLSNPRQPWAERNAETARRAEAIVSRLDGSRLVYHHSSGNLGSMHTSNFYANFAPIQELSDWLETWATKGRKPLFLCEYGAPLSWDWTMYRGWFRGKRAFGSARVPWEFCLAEWNAQFLGDRAFEISEAERRNLRWEAEQVRAGRLWHRWDYPHHVGSRDFPSRDRIYARYITRNFRAFRTWGLSAVCPWNHGHYWRMREGVDKGRRDLPVDWARLQRPGLSPDFVEGRYERMDLAYGREDWVPSAASEALTRNTRPLLAYIAGRPGAFTEQGHTFLPGETVEKQIIVLNDSRETVTCACEWSLDLPEPRSGTKRVEVETGEQARIPLSLSLPDSLASGAYELRATFRFSTGEQQEDAFTIHVLPRPDRLRPVVGIALFDPEGESKKLLRALGVRFRTVKAGSTLSPRDVLVVGKKALTIEGPAPDLTAVRDGLRVLVFEQTAAALEKRLGFRVAEYGLRRVFPRIPDHPLLEGVETSHLRDWRGSATLSTPRLDYEMRPRHGPTVKWCGIPVTRIWRCGNRGNVASVLIEKPGRGDFLPILDGGFSLQYSPLLLHRTGRGAVLFCQLDVTGRTEPEPEAERLVGNMIAFLDAYVPPTTRRTVYVGEAAGRAHLERAGFAPRELGRGELEPGDVLVVGPGGEADLASRRSRLAGWLRRGGRTLAIGLDGEEARRFLPMKLATTRGEHIAAYFPPPAATSLLAGVAPADVHCRQPRKIPLVTAGAKPVGNGALAAAEDRGVVFYQLVPWRLEPAKHAHERRTFRRASSLLTRLLANLGADSRTPLFERFAAPVRDGERRWLEGLYLDEPVEWDDPYRFFRW